MNLESLFYSKIFSKYLFTFLVVFLASGATSGADSVEFRVFGASKSQMLNFARNTEIAIDHVEVELGGTYGFELYAEPSIVRDLKKAGLGFFEVPKVSEKLAQDYPTSREVNQKLYELQKTFPELLTIIEIGKSVQGKPLLFVRVTAQPNANLPKFKYIANMHGDEIVGRELMVRFIEDLAQNFGKDSRVNRLLNSADIYIMPSMNPDGADAQMRGNANRKDLNRDFPDFRTSDNQNSMSGRQPETQAVMAFQAKHRFKLSANFHGGTAVVNYPWDAGSVAHPHENFFIKISRNYANLVPYIKNSVDCGPGRVIPKCSQGIVRGFDWYPVFKGMQDWSYNWHNDYQITLEVSFDKWPEYSEIPGFYSANRPALIRYIEEMFEF